MIFGSCPYCDESFTTDVPDRTPVFEKMTCEKCGKWFWEKLSRLDPEAYFPEEVEVDEINKSVKLKETKS